MTLLLQNKKMSYPDDFGLKRQSVYRRSEKETGQKRSLSNIVARVTAAGTVNPTRHYCCTAVPSLLRRCNTESPMLRY